MSGVQFRDQALYESPIMMTPFNEPVFSELFNKISHRPTWGVSQLRNLTTTTGSGTIDEVDGFIEVSTGTTSGSTAKLETIERGQYVPGGIGQMGAGIQIPTIPTASGAFGEWGYFGGEDGYGFGIDADGFYFFVLNDSVQTKYRQADWTNEPEEDLTEVVQNGCVWQINFTWYGFGSIEWRASLKQNNGSLRRMEPIHAFVPVGPSIVDPNQPITVRCDNGSGTEDIVVKVGGRQFASTRQGLTDRRLVPENVEYTTTVGAGNWEPVLAIRPKSIFRGRPNSIQKVLESFQILANDDIEFRWFFDSTISGATWAEADGYPATETSVEFANAGVATFTRATGVPFAKGFSLASQNKGVRTFTDQYRLNFEGGQALALEVKPINADTKLFINATVAEGW